jgi:hypothetical protein
MNRIYTPFDIVWTKNVSNNEAGSAYMDIESEDFVLHFPTRHRGNVLSPKIDEIILIHQNIGGQKVFTHLVTPIDDILREENRADHRFGRKVKIIAKADLSNPIPVSSTLWNRINFQGISNGNACEVANMSNIGEYDDLLQDIWEHFVPFFRQNFTSSLAFTESAKNEIENSDPELSVTEGKLRLITHYARERDRGIVQEKKRQALINELLKCEVCDFSFINKYGIEFIECHHRTPIAQTGVTETTLKDLALVCANCHRMLHKQFDGRFLSIEELREIVNIP